MDNLQKQIGERIRRRRMGLGMMQTDLAEAVQMPQGHISRFERGKFVAIHPEVLVSLAQALQTTTDYLLGLSTDPDVTTNGSPRSTRRRKTAPQSEPS